MTEIAVITNNAPRDIIEGWELTADERKQFDYLDWPAIGEGEDSASFFRYKGELYDLGDFMAIPLRGPHNDFFEGWDGYISDTFFSGILVKYAEDMEHVIVGRFCG